MSVDDIALFIIDVQEGFINKNTSHIPEAVQALQRDYKHVHIFQFQNFKTSPWVKWLDYSKFQNGDQYTPLAFEPGPEAVIHIKRKYSCYSEDLISRFIADNITEIHLCGISTDACVLTTAIDIFEDNRLRPVVKADFCASHGGQEAHDSALYLLPRLIGPTNIDGIRL